MKFDSIIYVILTVALFSCNSTTNGAYSDTNFYSVKVDTSYNLSDRTIIDEINRYIYLKKSKDATKSLSLSKKTKVNSDNSKFTIIKIDATDINDIESSILSFKSEEEVQQLFNKIDSIEDGKSLNERKKTKHYEITKYNSTIEIKQFDGSINIEKKVSLTTLEYDGIKASFKKYLLEEIK